MLSVAARSATADPTLADEYKAVLLNAGVAVYAAEFKLERRSGESLGSLVKSFGVQSWCSEGVSRDGRRWLGPCEISPRGLQLEFTMVGIGKAITAWEISR